MSTIKLKRSSVGGKIPQTTQLDLGEIALNTYDGRLYIKKSVNGVEEIVGFYGSNFSEESIYVDTFSGDGSTAAFVLSYSPKSDQYVYVTVNGVQQHISEYSLDGQTITLTEAPEVGDLVEIRTHNVASSGLSLRDYKTYLYTASSSTTFSGADDNGATLTYEVGKVEVYVNGSRIVDGFDYTATDGSSISIVEPVTGIVEIVSLARAVLVDQVIQPNTVALTTTATDQVADQFLASQFRTAKYLIQMSDGTNVHATEVLLIHDGTNVYMTEYGTVYSSASMGNYDADIVNGYVRLLVTPTNINTTVKIQRLSVTV